MHKCPAECRTGGSNRIKKFIVKLKTKQMWPQFANSWRPSRT